MSLGIRENLLSSGAASFQPWAHSSGIERLVAEGKGTDPAAPGLLLSRRAEGVRFAQAGTMALPSGTSAPAASVRLPGGQLATASQLLQLLRSQAEFRQIDSVMDRFGLDKSSAADVLGARAYVWASYKMPWVSKMPFSGPGHQHAAQAIMTYERAHPGTALQADHGKRAALDALVAVANDAVTHGQPLERRSAISPALSTNSVSARALVAAGTRMQNWQAHHLIPFAEVAALPTKVQLAIVRAGWKMDSPENVIALPANAATYAAPPNLGARPIHNRAHAVYSAEASTRLTNLRVNGASMTDAQIRTELRAIESAMTASLLNRAGRYHPVVI